MNRKEVSIALQPLDDFLQSKIIFDKHLEMLETMPVYCVINGIMTRIRLKKLKKARID